MSGSRRMRHSGSRRGQPAETKTARLCVLLAALTCGCAASAEVGVVGVPLEGGRSATIMVADRAPRARFHFVSDPAVRPAGMPLGCPSAVPKIRIRGSGGFDTGQVSLPCDRWISTAHGFRYLAQPGSDGGVRKVVYREGRLSAWLRGRQVALEGEAPSFLEVSFTPGSGRYCGRFESFALRGGQARANGSRGCAPEGPNIVLILGDDIDWRRLSPDDTQAMTPALDDLRSAGVTFPTGHLSASVCRPVHLHLLSGRHPHSERDRTWGSLPEEMAESGRRTFQAGKIWAASPVLWGFEENAGDVCDGKTDRTCGNPDFGREGWDVARCGITGDARGNCPATQAWRHFLEDHDFDGGERFFAMFTPLLPHTPHTPPHEYLELYPGASRRQRVYLAMLTWFDGLVAEIVRDLEAAGLRDGTLVVYMADNGYRSTVGFQQPTLPTTLRGKGSLHEMGMRTQIIATWPGSTAHGVAVPGVVGVEDVFASLLSATGQFVPDAVHGYDLVPSWKMGQPNGRKQIVTRFKNFSDTLGIDGFVVRTESRRYIRDVGNGTEHLYAIDVDPDEKDDIIGSASEAELRAFDEAIAEWEVATSRREGSRSGH